MPSNDGLGGMGFQEDMGCKYARYTRGQVLRQAPLPHTVPGDPPDQRLLPVLLTAVYSSFAVPLDELAQIGSLSRIVLLVKTSCFVHGAVTCGM